MYVNKLTPLDTGASPKTMNQNWLSINAITANPMLSPQLWHPTFESCTEGQASDPSSLTVAFLLPTKNSDSCFESSHSQVSRKSVRISPFRSVEKMKEPFQLLLSTPWKLLEDRRTFSRTPLETDKSRRCNAMSTQHFKDHLIRARRNAFVLLRDQEEPGSGLWYTDFDLSKPKFHSFLNVDAFLDGEGHSKAEFWSTGQSREERRVCDDLDLQPLQIPETKHKLGLTPSCKRPASSMESYRSKMMKKGNIMASLFRCQEKTKLSHHTEEPEGEKNKWP